MRKGRTSGDDPKWGECAWKSHTVFGDTPCSLCDLGFWKIPPYVNSGVGSIVVGTYPIVFHKMVKLCAHKTFGSRKGPLAAQCFAFVNSMIKKNDDKKVTKKKK